MPIDDFIISVYCCVVDLFDEALKKTKLRQRGCAPKMTDEETITLEIVGEFLGIETDKQIWEYFKRHWIRWFPNLPCRTSFVRQAANLGQIKQLIQRLLATQLGALEDSLHVIDGFPIPTCLFARARRGRLFKGDAGYSRCATKKQVYYGFKGHLVISGNGIISSLMITAANVEEHQPVEELVQDIRGMLIGDKGFISQFLKERLLQMDINLQTPLKKNMKDERDPKFLSKIKGTRRLIETVIGQLNERFNFSVVWARDFWHLLGRLARKALAHTTAIFLNKKRGVSLLQFSTLLTV